MSDPFVSPRPAFPLVGNASGDQPVPQVEIELNRTSVRGISGYSGPQDRMLDPVWHDLPQSRSNTLYIPGSESRGDAQQEQAADAVADSTPDLLKAPIGARPARRPG